MTREADEPTLDPSMTRAPSAAGARSSSSSQADFVPGTIVAGRYRLVALLGRGGMGEVYRADDLTLDQAVALKFLPAGVALDDARLAQFHNELRTARQIAHKNVCRLYDLGEFDGRRFLTMEYVDGEDLASLLRRIGRLPQDKAVQIARQLCAGISAAHERGVVHRDLKPANVMLDGDGNVRVTDFGLAASSGDQAAVWAGTPQYMAPEQLIGKPATIQSDIYALGLVLYEIFTGRRAHQAQTLEELRRAHDSGSLTSPSSHVRDIDPAVERVIMRCLARDPAARPSSVLGVAASLPGANPLADALAAGETPSPELIAAAGKTEALPAAIGLGLLAFALVGLIVLGMVNSRTLLVTRIPFDRSIEVLEDRAEETIRALGYVDEPVDSAGGLLSNAEAIGWIARTDQSASRWDRLASGSLPTLRFWYRTSPQPLEGQEPSPRFGDPPFTTPRMLSAIFDTMGRLTSLAVIPPPRDGAALRSSMDWSRLFDAAGLSLEKFRSVPATRTPTVFADERAAWEGPLHGHDDITVHVEAAAHEGLPVFFTMSGPWTSAQAPAAPAMPTVFGRIANVLSEIVPIVVFVFGAWLARGHYRSGRADLRTANRAFLAIVVIWLAIWVFETRHVADVGREWSRFSSLLPSYLMNAAVFWLLYVALEPFARRHTPEMLFSWTRLMRGEIRDPRVGRDVLIGLVVATLLGLVWVFAPYLAGMFGQPPPPPRGVQPQFLLSSSNAIARTLRFAPQALQNAMLFAFVFVLARAWIGRLWPAALAVFAVSTLLTIAESGFEPVAFTLGTLFAAGLIAVLVRAGVFALATAWFTFFVLSQGPITTDFGATYGAISAWLMMIVSAIAVYAFYASRGGQPLIGNQFTMNN